MLAACGGGSDNDKSSNALPDSSSQSQEAAPAPEETQSTLEGAPADAAAVPAGEAGAPAPAGTTPGSPSSPKSPTGGAKRADSAKSTTGGAGGGPSSPAAKSSSAAPSTPAPPIPGTPAAPAPKEGNGGATDRGVSADEVKFGGIMMYGWLGLAEQVWEPITREQRVLFKIVNDNGGIFGRKLTYIDCDDGPGDPARTRACYKKLVEQDKIFAMSAGCSLSEDQYQADLKRDQIPAFSPCSLYHVEWQNEYSFPIHMDMRQEGAATALWALNTKKPKTYGVLCLNIPDSQAACGNVEKQMDKAGAKQVFKRTYRSGTPDMSGDIIAARAANPDFIFDYSIDAFVGARFMIDAQQQDYWPPMGMVANHKTIEPLGGIIGDYPAKKGYWNNTTYLLWGPDHIAWQRKYVPNNKGLSHHVLQGQWFGTQAMIECMQRIGPNLTRPALMGCMNSQRWETGPGLGQAVMWEPGKRYGDNTVNTKEYVYKYVSTETQSGDDGKTRGWIPDPAQFVITAPTPAGE
jgi:ABC-type branched-subunit amino acid transport system substrate-binding protein